jgi:hypothetical protein
MRTVGFADRYIGLAALEAAGVLVGELVGAVGAANNRPDPGGGLAGPALALELDHHIGARRRTPRRGGPTGTARPFP